MDVFPKHKTTHTLKHGNLKKKKKNAANNVINFYHKPYSLPFHPTDQRSWLIPKSLLWEDKTWLINLISIVRGQKVNGPGVHRHIHFTELFLCSYGWTEEKTIFLSFKVHKFVQLLYWWRIITESALWDGSKGGEKCLDVIKKKTHKLYLVKKGRAREGGM